MGFAEINQSLHKITLACFCLIFAINVLSFYTPKIQKKNYSFQKFWNIYYLTRQKYTSKHVGQVCH